MLPFINLSGDAEQEYFSDGITEDIITDLSKIGGVLVIARNSSFAYKDKSVDIRNVGRARARRSFGPRRQRPPRRQPGENFGAANRHRNRGPFVG